MRFLDDAEFAAEMYHFMLDPRYILRGHSLQFLGPISFDGLVNVGRSHKAFGIGNSVIASGAHQLGDFDLTHRLNFPQLTKDSASTAPVLKQLNSLGANSLQHVALLADRGDVHMKR